MQDPKQHMTIQEHSAAVIAEIRAENDERQAKQRESDAYEFNRRLRQSLPMSERLKSHFQAQRMIRRADGGK